MEINRDSADRYLKDYVQSVMRNQGNVIVGGVIHGRTYVRQAVKALSCNWTGRKGVKGNIYKVLGEDIGKLLKPLLKVTRYVRYLSHTPDDTLCQEVCVGRRLQDELGCDDETLALILGKAVTLGLIYRTSEYGSCYISGYNQEYEDFESIIESLGVYQETHYIYQMEHFPSGQTYIGQRQIGDREKLGKFRNEFKSPWNDGYFGSGAKWKKIFQSDPVNCVKRVLDVSFSQKTTDYIEREQIAVCRALHGSKCVNIQAGGMYKWS